MRKYKIFVYIPLYSYSYMVAVRRSYHKIFNAVQDSRIRLIAQHGCCTVHASQNIFVVVHDPRIHFNYATCLLYCARVTKSSMYCNTCHYATTWLPHGAPIAKIHSTPCKILVYITFLQHGCRTYRHYCVLHVHPLRHHYCIL